MDIKAVLGAMVKTNASDLHIKVGSAPALRINGRLQRLNMPSVTQDDMMAILNMNEIVPPSRKKRFEETNESDFSVGVSGLGRFRFNCYVQRGTPAISVRLIPMVVPDLDQLNLPEAIKEIASLRRGLVLATGATGSGKSTTLAAIVDYINNTDSVNIITIEDPVEFLYRDKKSIISQREIGSDTESFSTALIRAFRQDPNVILLGEIRDAQTMREALSAAETGHLVLSTLHTADTIHTIGRILSFFPPHESSQARILVADTLEAVISLRLLPRNDAQGRIPAAEILIGTPAIKQCIVDPERSNQIKMLMESGEVAYGMQTFDQGILKLYRAGKISYEEAIKNCTSPEDFDLKVRGIDDTSRT